MDNLKRSEKYRLFKDHGVPRYMMLNAKEKRRENATCAFVAFMMLILAFYGRTEAQQTFGMLALFAVSLIGVFNR